MARRPRKRRKNCDPRNIKLARGLAKGMSKKKALEYAGLSSKNPSQSAYQGLKSLERYMPEVLHKYGLTPDSLVLNHLLPLLTAQETKHFPYRTTEIVKAAHVKVVTVGADGKKLKVPVQVTIPAVERTVQKIDTRDVINWTARRDGLDMAFRVGGHYAADNLRTPPETNIGVKVILVGVPRPGGPAPAIEVSTGNGHKPENGNGNV